MALTNEFCKQNFLSKILSKGTYKYYFVLRKVFGHETDLIPYH